MVHRLAVLEGLYGGTAAFLAFVLLIREVINV